MWRTLLLVATIAVVGCSQAPSEPEPKVDPIDVKKRAESRDKVINKGNQPN